MTRLDAVEEIFSLALETPEPDRAVLIKDRTADPAVRSAVEALLAAHDSAGAFLLTPPGAPADLETQPRRAGERFGAYEVVEPIGAGGMGVVYRARRVDEQFERVVAIKVLHPWADAPALRRRFESERRLLARLEHPSIAMLLDSGVTPAGEAYFVMEHIQGRTLIEHGSGLPLAERLQLFIDVCEAVEAAHRRLIVHLDLKPSNILVNGEGRVKLVDFGVSRLVVEDGEGAERAHQVFTPAYAAPEQLEGADATTATDVYALGVVLRELLTGQPAREQDRASAPSESLRETTPRLARRLAGDLDAIILRATREAPEERYASPAAIADDLRRHLERRPVSARPPTPGYVLSRFVRRRRGAVAAGALLLATLVVGATAVLWQAGVAGSERDRAERRFSELRALTGDLLTDVSAKLEDLPGATGARQEMIASASAYLDSLAAEASDEPGLLLELAGSHEQLGRLQRNMISSHLGDPDAALQSHRRALELRRQALSLRPGDDAAQIGVANSLLLIGDMHRAQGRLEEAIDHYRQSETAFALAVSAADELDRLHRRAVVLLKIGIAEARRGNYEDADEAYRRALEINQLVLDRQPDRPVTLRNAAVSYEKLGDIQEWREDPAAALILYRKALEIQQRLQSTEPGDARHLYAVAIVHSKIGEVLGHPAYANLGDVAGAVSHYQTGRALLKPLLADEEDERARATAAFFDRRLGTFLAMLGRYDEAIEHQLRAHAAATAFASRSPTEVRAQLDDASSRLTLADTYDAMGRGGDAFIWRRGAVRILRRVLSLSPDDVNAKAELAVSLHKMAGHLASPSVGSFAGVATPDPLKLVKESLSIFADLDEAGALSRSLKTERDLAERTHAQLAGPIDEPVYAIPERPRVSR